MSELNALTYAKYLEGIYQMLDTVCVWYCYHALKWHKGHQIKTATQEVSRKYYLGAKENVIEKNCWHVRG